MPYMPYMATKSFLMEVGTCGVCCKVCQVEEVGKPRHGASGMNAGKEELLKLPTCCNLAK
jgi:hypothetical protein